MIAPDTDGYYHLGPHRFRFEAPDIVHIFFHGTVEPEHFDRFFQWATGLNPDCRVYLLRDARSGGNVAAKTRARIIEIADPRRVAAIVSYGSSFHLRIIVTMLAKAVRSFKKAAPEVAFFDGEPEARAWIEAHRVRASGARA